RRGSGADRNSRNIPSCRTRDDGSRPALGASNGSADCGSSGGLVRSFARLAVSRESIGRPPPRAFHSGHRRDLCFKMNWGSNDAWSDFARTGAPLGAVRRSAARGRVAGGGSFWLYSTALPVAAHSLSAGEGLQPFSSSYLPLPQPPCEISLDALRLAWVSSLEPFD